ncbi:MAG: plasmid pRiA4b ORF-3 family protein [Clostridiales bacterium]|nr:plasmid pRiA4b ORF-3 family protein [Clostridiales bacterium]
MGKIDEPEQNEAIEAEHVDDFNEKLAYVTARAAEEGRIPAYLANELKNKITLDTFIASIIKMHDMYFDEEEDYFSLDEIDHVTIGTGYSKDIVELAMWFEECYSMSMDHISTSFDCPECGCDTMYIKELSGELFAHELECAQCRKKYSFELVFSDVDFDDFDDDDDDDFDDFDFDDDDDDFVDGFFVSRRRETEDSYIFNVSHGRGVWRKIQISKGDTLDDLSEAILRAYDFDNDHIYAFYMDAKGRTRNVPVFYPPRCLERQNAAEQVLEDLGLIKGSKFLFLYDFGDQWRFNVKLESEINEETPFGHTIKSQGEGPKQYDLDEDDDEDWDFD